MTHDRTDAITDQFEAWLRGYTPPRAMENDMERQAAEKVSLLRIVLKFAPMDDFRRFITEALDACAMQMKTRAWPTQHELGATFRNYRKENPHFFSSHFPNDGEMKTPAEINANKMRAGDAVGECWLYGILACEMIARRLIDQDTMTRYRSAAFLNRRAFYGEAKARAWEDEVRSGHEEAKEVWRRRNEPGSHDTGDIAALVKYPGAEHVAF